MYIIVQGIVQFYQLHPFVIIVLSANRRVKKLRIGRVFATPYLQKDKAPLSQTSTERIRSKIVSLNSIKNDLLIENKYLKQQVLDLQIELNESSLKVSNELDCDLKTIFF